jgi:hypothetical protein
MAVGFAACGGAATPSTTVYPAPGTFPPVYQFFALINPPKTASFDIGFVDESVHMYLLADRSTNGIDVVNSLTNAFLGTAGSGMGGLGTTVAGFARSPNAGPNGVVSLGNGLAAAGAGDSTLKIVNFATPTSAVVASIAVPNPYTGANLPPNICQGTVGAATGAPTVGAGNFRLDELAYEAADNVIIGVSDNSCPVFVTFFNGSAPYNILGQVALLTANGGGEQPVWDPAQGLFLVAIPSTVANPNGEIDLFSPKTFTRTGVLPLSTLCNPAGLVIGQNETAVAACGAGSMLTFNAVTGKVTNQVLGPAPDEAWYSPVSNRFYGADTGNAQLVVLDGNGNLLSKTNTFAGSHSVAVESLNDHVFVPENGGANLGIVVFDH